MTWRFALAYAAFLVATSPLRCAAVVLEGLNRLLDASMQRRAGDR